MRSEIVLEAVEDIDAAWDELEPLYRGLHEHHLPLVPGRRLREDWADAQRRSLSGTEPRLVLLARVDRSAVGLAEGVLRSHPFVEEEFGYLNVAYVVPTARGGVGRALFDRFAAWCREHGMSEVRLRVETANALGVSVWEGLGFRPFAVEMVRSL